jgi:predicted YcjX-like family ATPase
LLKPGQGICTNAKSRGCILSSRGALSFRGFGWSAGVAVFPWPGVDATGESKLAQAGKHTNAGMLRERYNYYCEKVVKGFYKNHFLRFDRQIVLVDCLQPLNSGPQAFNDMRLALTQLMQSFHYGQRTLFRRLFSPVIDKLLFAATKADHVTLDQHANMVSLLQQLVQDAWQNAAFEGISMDCLVGLGASHAEWVD